MPEGCTRRVFLEMIREEWRLHGQLFGGGHLALFPVVIAGFTAGAAWLLVATGTAPGTIFAGLHALAFVFGLHTGSIGLVGRDALRDLLGDVTLLVFSARTLPLSQGRLLGLFVLKDVVYYAALFLLPVSFGALPAIRVLDSGVASTAGLVILLWITLTLAFVLGMAVTIAGLGIGQRGVVGIAMLLVAVVSVLAAWARGVDVLAVTPYGVFLDPSPHRVGASICLLAGMLLVGAITFDASARRPARVADPAFRRWANRVGNPIATKTLLDLHRSSGGFGKVAFSGLVLFGVTAGLVDLVGRITGVAPSVGISFGAILGLTGFTTYNWLTQADDVEGYLVHPLAVSDIFAAKFRAYLLVGPGVGVGYYVLALGWRGGPIAEALVGAVLLVGVTCYIFGTTVALTGLSPNEFLFDPARFGLFGVAMIVPLVPVLVVAFALAPLSWEVLGMLGVVGVVLGIAGIGLYRRSVPRWTVYLRTR